MTIAIKSYALIIIPNKQHCFPKMLNFYNNSHRFNKTKKRNSQSHNLSITLFIGNIIISLLIQSIIIITKNPKQSLGKLRFCWRWINFFKRIYYFLFIFLNFVIYILYYNLRYLFPTDKYLNYFKQYSPTTIC